MRVRGDMRWHSTHLRLPFWKQIGFTAGNWLYARGIYRDLVLNVEPFFQDKGIKQTLKKTLKKRS